MADADPKIVVDDGDAIAVENVTAEVKQRKWLRPVLMISVPLLIALVGGYLWLTSGRFESTENAYVQQNKVSVSSDVSGRITGVYVHENEPVKKGQLLFAIDPQPYQIAVDKAKAAIANAQVQVQTLQTSYAGTGADISAARDAIQQAQEDYSRQSALMKRGFTTRERLQQSEHAVEQAKARLQNALADAAEAKSKLATGAAVPGENPDIAAARVELQQAQLNLNRTKRYAPVAGIVTQTDSLQVGQQMVTGLPALSIVADSPVWIEANFKETQLDHMCVGQPAEVTFDAYPDLKLKGHVMSMGAGTGSEFSVLPAQNANGNWVKVTQRVPVRIAIDSKSPRPMIAGLSASVSVDVRNHANC